jgi:hypothetical protein
LSKQYERYSYLPVRLTKAQPSDRMRKSPAKQRFSLVDDPCVASIEEQTEALGAGKDADVAVFEIARTAPVPDRGPRDVEPACDRAVVDSRVHELLRRVALQLVVHEHKFACSADVNSVGCKGSCTGRSGG